MIVLKILAYTLGVFGVVGTLLPFLRKDDYWIRGFDYPRLQLIFILGVSALCWILSRQTGDPINYLIGTILLAAAIYQAVRIYPYTPLHDKPSRDARYPDDKDRHLTLLISNVLQTNDRATAVIDLVKAHEPDILLTVETNKWWENQLSAGFEGRFPYRVPVPLENLYGMHLWSNVELIDPRVTYRVKDDIPGIDTRVRLRNGRMVDLHFVHPMPPSPSEAYASTGRDAELSLLGFEIADKPDASVIVAGDMNDVAWSHSSRLFQRISGMLDPRRGRGLYSTFHAEHRFLRWPLDHVFHTPDFALVQLERLSYVGSDHFPVLITLSYEPEQDEGQEQVADQDDIDEGKELVELAEQGKDNTVIDGR